MNNKFVTELTPQQDEISYSPGLLKSVQQLLISKIIEEDYQGISKIINKYEDHIDILDVIDFPLLSTNSEGQLMEESEGNNFICVLDAAIETKNPMIQSLIYPLLQKADQSNINHYFSYYIANKNKQSTFIDLMSHNPDLDHDKIMFNIFNTKQPNQAFLTWLTASKEVQKFLYSNTDKFLKNNFYPNIWVQQNTWQRKYQGKNFEIMLPFLNKKILQKNLIQNLLPDAENKNTKYNSMLHIQDHELFKNLVLHDVLPIFSKEEPFKTIYNGIVNYAQANMTPATLEAFMTSLNEIEQEYLNKKLDNNEDHTTIKPTNKKLKI